MPQQNQEANVKIIDSFSGEYAFLSNFYDSPIKVKVLLNRDVIFPTAEHLFQAYKLIFTQTPLSVEELITWTDRFLAAETPGRSKRLGRKVPLNVEQWNQHCSAYMDQTIWLKFTQNPHLADLLLSTGDATLVEGNTWGDTIWGVCNGVGENRLGKSLMRLRKYLRA